MMEKIFADDAGNPSSMRVFVGFILVAQIGVWATYCIRNNVVQPMDLESVLTILGALYFKKSQKQIEGASNAQVSSD